MEPIMPSLLLIDDEENVRYSFRYVFEDNGVEVRTAATAAEGWDQIRTQPPDVIVLDLHLPDRSGLDLYQDIRFRDPKRPVIFITAHGTADTAIEAMKRGAFDYLVKPVDLDQLNQILDRAFEAARLMHVPAVLPAEEGMGDRIVARSRVMQEMCKTIGRIAPQDVNVLIWGESGTGKELVARALYHHSRRADKPFLAINCAAIPETLLESELFGHEQGAFTGAHRRRIGKFEQCDGGTLFLDEIGDMPPSLQAKMLRVLQEQRFERLGSNETVETRVRVLAATNADLERLVAEGRFRKDLYYRLKVVMVQVPPLRERLDEVHELAHYFLARFNNELGLDLRGFAPETLELLQCYLWPGNVRELQSAIKQAMLNASGQILLPEFLPSNLVHRRSAIPVHALAPSGATAPGSPLTSPTPALNPATAPFADLRALVQRLLDQGEQDVYSQVIDAVDRVVLGLVLQHTHGHQGQSSEVLGMARATLRHKLRHLGLAVDKILTEAGLSADASGGNEEEAEAKR
jgi:two-component system nitrogen regulation response regulator GlnG